MNRSTSERTLLLRRRVAQARSEPQGLSDAAVFYGALIETLIAETAAVELSPLDGAVVETRLAAGLSILAGESFGMDAAAVQQTLLKLCAVAERQPMPLGAAAQIRTAFSAGRLDLDALIGLLLAGDERGFAALAISVPVDAALLQVLVQFALRPTFLAWADACAVAVENFGRRWQRTTCPVCGALPLLAELRDSDQSRHLRCVQCATAWQYPRLQCACCGSDDFRLLSNVQLEGSARYRVDTCGVCGRYLKGILAEEPIPADLLPLEDLLTLHLDAAAQQVGYQR